MTIEVLVPDFKGELADVDTVLAANPDVFAHNLETVPRLSREVRVQARYDRSYAVLRHARERGALVKTGLMLGLGETREELGEVIDQLGELGLTILTLGQYLQPSKKHLEVTRYVHPDEFAELKQYALGRGIPTSRAARWSAAATTPRARPSSSAACRHSHGRVGFASLAR
jgi:lipoic acid synthetase